MCVKPVLEVVPQADFGQRLFDGVVEFALCRSRLGVDAQAEDDVFIDRDRQRIRALEDHADLLAQLDERHVGS